jgi:hypothetical protein
MSTQYRVVDRVERETAAMLEQTDAVLAHDDDSTYVLEEVDEDGE